MTKSRRAAKVAVDETRSLNSCRKADKGPDGGYPQGEDGLPEAGRDDSCLEGTAVVRHREGGKAHVTPGEDAKGHASFSLPIASKESANASSGFFLEGCAGSAILSSSVMQLGMQAVPLDHSGNRHTPYARVVQLDLARHESWGVDEKGQFRTAEEAEYPKELAAALARLFVDACGCFSAKHRERPHKQA